MRKAEILAAGKWTRMKELTRELPKPLLPLEGKPLLEHVLDRLRTAGTTEVLLVIGHMGELIRDAFRAYPLTIKYVVQETVTGTARAALLARDFAGSDPFLLTYADILTEPADYANMWRIVEEDPATEAVVGVKWVDDPFQGAAVYVQEGSEDVVSRIQEKPPKGTSTTHWNSSGQYIFRPSIFEELEQVPLSSRGEYELTSAIEQFVAQGRRVRMYALAGAWRDVGRPEDLPAAQRIVSGRE